MASIDILDAYMHIPICPLHRYLAFLLHNHFFCHGIWPITHPSLVYADTFLASRPFTLLTGLSVCLPGLLAPFSSIQVVAPISSNSNARNPDQLGMRTQPFQIKSEPFGRLIWLGLSRLPQEGYWTLPEDKILYILNQIHHFCSSWKASLHQWEQLVRKLMFAAQILKHFCSPVLPLLLLRPLDNQTMYQLVPTNSHSSKLLCQLQLWNSQDFRGYPSLLESGSSS